jgi:hypothetical protein
MVPTPMLELFGLLPGSLLIYEKSAVTMLLSSVHPVMATLVMLPHHILFNYNLYITYISIIIFN